MSKKEVIENASEKSELDLKEAPETPKIIDEPVELTKLTAEDKYFAETVEDLRQVILKENKKSSTLSTVSMIVVAGLCCAGFIFMTINAIVSYILLGCAVAALIVMAIIIKRIAQPDIKGYIRTCSTEINRYVFNDGRYSNCIYDGTKKIVFSEIQEDGVYDNIKECVSRNVVEGKFQGRSFKAAELGIYKEGTKRMKPTAFVGKYLTFPNDLHFVDRIVIISKGSTDIDIPDAIGDLSVAYENERFSIFAPESCNIDDILNKKFIEAIKNIEVDNHLLTLCVTLWAGRSVVYASYDDQSVTLPFQKEIDDTCYKQYASDTLKELEALKMLLED